MCVCGWVGGWEGECDSMVVVASSSLHLPGVILGSPQHQKPETIVQGTLRPKPRGGLMHVPSSQDNSECAKKQPEARKSVSHDGEG